MKNCMDENGMANWEYRCYSHSQILPFQIWVCPTLEGVRMQVSMEVYIPPRLKGLVKNFSKGFWREERVLMS